jgi:hypothetical protein
MVCFAEGTARDAKLDCNLAIYHREAKWSYKNAYLMKYGLQRKLRGSAKGVWGVEPYRGFESLRTISKKPETSSAELLSAPGLIQKILSIKI